MTKEHSHAEIADRAYQLWEAEGKPSGRDTIHWLRAEAELNGKVPPSSGGFQRPTSMTRPKKTKPQRRGTR